MGFLFGVTYTLTHPDGTIAVFNSPSDPNFVGYLTDIAGLDSPEVRESGDVYTERDGGINGNNYYGRRPLVLEGLIPQSAEALRQARIEKLQRASNAMRVDATLSWTEPQDGIQRRVLVRRQVPARITGGVDKRFVIGLVSASHLIESAAQVTTDPGNLTANVTNSGNAEALPIITLTHSGAAAATTSPTTVTIGGVVALKLNMAQAPGAQYQFDFAKRTAKQTSGAGANIYRFLDAVATTWKPLPPGLSAVVSDKGTWLMVQHRHSWV